MYPIAPKRQQRDACRPQISCLHLRVGRSFRCETSGARRCQKDAIRLPASLDQTPVPAHAVKPGRNRVDRRHA